MEDNFDKITPNERLMRIALYLGLNNNSSQFYKILNFLGSAEAIFSGAWDLSTLGVNLSPLLMGGLVEFALEEMEKAEKKNFKIIVYGEDAYPKRLLEIPEPAPVLWVNGELFEDDLYSVAIIGSRSASEFGLNTAKNLAEEAAEAGITVISGLAKGIDSQAHIGALNKGGRTLAVLGSGLDWVYPKENKNLYEIIPENGAVISEFPIDTKPLPAYFPRRNRVVAGLSLAILVIEAGERSGALITARLGLELNREVLAVPGRLGDKNSRGTNRLIKNGAALVESFDDVLNEIKPRLLEGLCKKQNKTNKTINLNSLLISDKSIKNKEQENLEIPEGNSGLIFKELLKNARKIDDLISLLELSVEEVSEILLILELDGKIVKQTSGFYEIVKG